MDTESAGTSALRLRAESALRALAEGRRRLAHGVTAVAQLQEALEELRETQLGINLREVQESIVEHSAMYAKNPEVLGGMLHLVFSLDLLNQWQSKREEDLQERFRHLEALQAEMMCSRHTVDQLTKEVREVTSLSVSGACPDTPTSPGARPAQWELQELQQENARLRQLLAQQSAEPVALEPVASPRSARGSAHSVWLAALEPLEPLLAAMPMGSQEALDLQEEACEAYGHLRRVVLQAARV
ncbi:unnamed protein product [Durusdinium trenchii]|uniref:WD repeat-containing protein C17D11.16 n=2 Tax=Durusdinium trenchii TaxID=1381693 RepID=A0ABP0KZP6_9DINO